MKLETTVERPQIVHVESKFLTVFLCTPVQLPLPTRRLYHKLKLMELNEISMYNCAAVAMRVC